MAALTIIGGLLFWIMLRMPWGPMQRLLNLLQELLLNLQIVERELQGLTPLFMELKFVAGFR